MMLCQVALPQARTLIIIVIIIHYMYTCLCVHLIRYHHKSRHVQTLSQNELFRALEVSKALLSLIFSLLQFRPIEKIYYKSMSVFHKNSLFRKS